MTSQMPGTPQEHYENLLADHYEWMFGLPFEAKVKEQETILDAFIGKNVTSGLAVDLGCGSGFQSVALSDRGYSVLAIDTSEKLLSKLSARTGSRNIVTKRGDLRELDSLVSPNSVGIAVCMGDTLTHLSSRSEVSRLFQSVARAQTGRPVHPHLSRSCWGRIMWPRPLHSRMWRRPPRDDLFSGIRQRRIRRRPRSDQSSRREWELDAAQKLLQKTSACRGVGHCRTLCIQLINFRAKRRADGRDRSNSESLSTIDVPSSCHEAFLRRANSFSG
jgi:SAM-dependent methyltransferase